MATKLCGPLMLYLLSSLVWRSTICLGLGVHSLQLHGHEYTVTTTHEDGVVHKMFMYEKASNRLVGNAHYNQTYLTTGWDVFSIGTTQYSDDDKQAVIAGYEEGYLTHAAIYDHYYNTIRPVCEGQADLCDKINGFLQDNSKWVDQMIKEKGDTDPYWNMVKLFYIQVAGIYLGYSAVAPANETIDYEHFLWMNFIWDISDLKSKFKNETQKSLRGNDHCSALIKILKDKSDILVSHNTWTGYETMRRMVKRYSLPFADVKATAMALSGYPGAIVSGDDFYVLDSGLVTQETTNSNNNPDLWKRIQPEGQLFEVVRVTVANRMADNGQSWTKIFAEYNSGTYNNQWMVVDMTQFSPGSVKPGLLWVAEQMPGMVRREDMTEVLVKQGYWSSFNIPYFSDIYNISGHPQLAKQYGDFFTHDKNPRSLIFKRDQDKVVDVRSMLHLMRSNDFQHDPLSRCACNPPYSAENAIASRNDLNPENGTYPFHALSHRSSGATDAKVTNWQMSRDLSMVAVSGPTTGAHLPPFRWSTAGFPKLSHRGHPDLFMFDPITVTWSHHATPLSHLR